MSILDSDFEDNFSRRVEFSTKLGLKMKDCLNHALKLRMDPNRRECGVDTLGCSALLGVSGFIGPTSFSSTDFMKSLLSEFDILPSEADFDPKERNYRPDTFHRHDLLGDLTRSLGWKYFENCSVSTKLRCSTTNPKEVRSSHHIEMYVYAHVMNTPMYTIACTIENDEVTNLKLRISRCRIDTSYTECAVALGLPDNRFEILSKLIGKPDIEHNVPIGTKSMLDELTYFLDFN